LNESAAAFFLPTEQERLMAAKNAEKSPKKESAVKVTKGGHAAANVNKPPTSTEPTTTPEQKDVQIQAERKKGKAEMAKNGQKPSRVQQYHNHEVGPLTWLTRLVCDYFELAAVGFQKMYTVWNFPKDLEDSKKRHRVARKFYHQIEGKFLMVDLFDANTPMKDILTIKAWMEVLGFRYTFIIGGEGSGDPIVVEGKKTRNKTEAELEADMKKFVDLVFVERLKVLDPKGKDYPKFRIPQTYQEAGISI